MSALPCAMCKDTVDTYGKRSTSIMLEGHTRLISDIYAQSPIHYEYIGRRALTAIEEVTSSLPSKSLERTQARWCMPGYGWRIPCGSPPGDGCSVGQQDRQPSMTPPRRRLHAPLRAPSVRLAARGWSHLNAQADPLAMVHPVAPVVDSSIITTDGRAPRRNGLSPRCQNPCVVSVCARVCPAGSVSVCSSYWRERGLMCARNSSAPTPHEHA